MGLKSMGTFENGETVGVLKWRLPMATCVRRQVPECISAWPCILVAADGGHMDDMFKRDGSFHCNIIRMDRNGTKHAGEFKHGKLNVRGIARRTQNCR